MNNSEFTIENNILKGKEIPCTDFEYGSVGEMILSRLKSDPDFVGQIDGTTGDKQTYEQMLDRSVRCALWMKTQGLLPGDVVAICCDNRLDVAMPCFAALYLGAIFNPLDTEMSAKEFRIIMTIMKPKMAFVNEASAVAVAQAAKEANLDMKIVVFGRVSSFPTFETIIAEPGINEVQDFRCTAIANPNETAIIMCTSGTTGFPKGVALAHTVILRKLQQGGRSAFNNPEIVFFTPIVWITGLLAMLLPVGNKSTRIVPPTFEEYTVCELLERLKVSYSKFSTTMINRLLKSDASNKYDLSSIKSVICGGENPLTTSRNAFAKKLPGASFKVGYGMTELGGSTSTQSNNAKPGSSPGSSGRILTNCQLKVVNPDTDKVLGTNQLGELLWKTDTMMNCYYNDPDATAATIDEEGWLHSGDLGYYDEDGEVFVVDRLKELIKYRGHLISSVEIESVLLSHPSVKEVAVVGLPHPVDGEHPIAFVVRTESSLTGKEVTEQELIDFVGTEMADSTRLQGGVKFLDHLPKTPSNKIRRGYVRDLARSMATT
ncbi:4-coumarate--CoA ligase 1-like [Diprion similis]|uniref:4-coumarate--CoA ligase 1-like n=1 Tax=Diprion similis TaxID=362088 RepID=UPI001EF7FE62|nr:4-coumarate--CoA ligase 1-like [Diprion similis]